MRIFLDTADVSAIEECMEHARIDGITTNPTLIRKSGKDPEDVYSQLVNLGFTDISMEVTGDAPAMYDEAIRLSNKYGKAATIKLPMTKDGLQVCSVLNKELIRTNVTLVFNIAQAILAARAGATYVSPFVGRIDDQGYAGLEVVRGIADLYSRKGVRTEILAASIRDPHRAVRSFFNGADIVTLPPSVLDKMYNHVLTDKGLEIFEKDLKGI